MQFIPQKNLYNPTVQQAMRNLQRIEGGLKARKDIEIRYFKDVHGMHMIGPMRRRQPPEY
jgi:hypothetical protein